MGKRLLLLYRGRVLYLLVGFLPAQVSPEQKLELLDRSIEKFRAALVREPNRTDAQFNLGQALHSRSEILQETSDIENSYTQSAVGRSLGEGATA